MTQFHPAWLEHQRKRFTRPDGDRYLRPDAFRYMKPEVRSWQFDARLNFKYSPDQPRVPAGNQDGGQWTDGDGASSDNPQSDATEFSAQRRDRASGHHYVPQSLSRNQPLSQEAQEVFLSAKTGRLYDINSNQFDEPHRAYNEAVSKLFENFTQQNNIAPERMTSEEAQSFVREVLISSDPRIRNFNMLIQMREIMQRIFRRPMRGE